MGSNILVQIRNYISNKEFLFLSKLIFMGSSIKILVDWKL